VPGGSGASFEARERETGREVTVHLLDGIPGAAAALTEMRHLPHAQRRIVYSGEHRGALCVVTAAPPHRGWVDLLDEQRKEVAEQERSGHAGAWKLPPGVVAASRPARTEAPPPPPPPVVEVGPEPEIEVNPLAATHFFDAMGRKEVAAKPSAPADLGATG